MTIRLKGCYLFVVTFYALHVTFCFFRLFLAAVFDWKIRAFGDDIVGPILFLTLGGLVTGVKFAMGYLLIDTFVPVHRESLAMLNRYHPMLAAVLAFASLLISIAIPPMLPLVSESLSDSYLGFIFRLQWATLFVGGLSNALVTVVAAASSRHHRSRAVLGIRPLRTST